MGGAHLDGLLTDGSVGVQETPSHVGEDLRAHRRLRKELNVVLQLGGGHGDRWGGGTRGGRGGTWGQMGWGNMGMYGGDTGMYGVGRHGGRWGHEGDTEMTGGDTEVTWR